MSNFNSGSVLDDVLDSTPNDDSSTVNSNEPAPADTSGSADGQTIEALSKELKGLQSMIGKWGNEMGEIRNMVSNNQQPAPITEEAPQSENDTWNRLLSDPDATFEQKMAEFMNKYQTQQQQQKQQVMGTLKGIAPDFEDHYEDIVATIASDSGVDKQQISSSLHGLGTAALYNVYERVKLTKQLNEAKNLLQAVKAQGTVDFDEAKRALARRPSSGDSTNSPASSDVPKVDVRSLSAEELGKLMEQRGIKRTT